jgi:hypothetical protein
MVNGLLTLRGAWHKVVEDPVLKFYVVAVTAYGMSTFEGPMLSVKSVNAPARDPHFGQACRVEGRPRRPAAERIGLRNAVEDQQGAAGGVAAQGTQGDALAGGIGRARVRTAEKLHTSLGRQQLVEPADRSLGKLGRADHRRPQQPLPAGGFERSAGHDNLDGGRRLIDHRRLPSPERLARPVIESV